jgi:hypothetical protein
MTTQPDTDAPPTLYDLGFAYGADPASHQHIDGCGHSGEGVDAEFIRGWRAGRKPPDAPQEGRPAMSDPKFVRDNRPLRWRIWWRFGFIPIVRIIGWLPIPEWRRDAWVRAVDIWSMDMNRRLDR